MFEAFTPVAVRLRTISATTFGSEQTCGAPEQFTLMPTTSEALKNRCHASAGLGSPVSVVIPFEIISRITAGSGFALFSSMERGECTETTLPGYGPGMPGRSDGLCAVTERYAGRVSPAAASKVP